MRVFAGGGVMVTGGTDDVLEAAIDEGVGCVIGLSTDKAAYPINARGISKALEVKAEE